MRLVAAVKNTLLSGAVLTGLVAGCGQALAQQTELKFVIWTYQPETVQGFVEEFERRNPDIDVTLDGAPSAEYNAKASLMFRSQTPFDVLYVRDASLIQWVENEWLMPLDQCSGLEETLEEMLPFAAANHSHEGKLYGLTYYSSIFPIAVNGLLLEQLGRTEAPDSFEGWIELAREAKEKGLSEYPLSWPIRQAGWGAMYIYAGMVASLGGQIFDEEMNPTPAATEALTWWRQTFEEGLSNPANIGWDHAEVANNFMAGDTLMQWTMQVFMGPAFSSHPERSAVAGHVRIVAPPGTGDMISLTAAYGISANTANKEEACKLVRFLGGKDENGVYNTPAAWVEASTLLWGQEGVESNPKVQAALASWGQDAQVFADYLKSAQTMDQLIPFFKTTWYFEWQEAADKTIQDVLSGQISVEDGLSSMSNQAKRLAERYGAE